ncbi:hypothetical protein HKCCE2091_15495 [Rhodobacterales bacterium HKCCE2091]|nr:hypothetical protein [Rhodobacterales bacterium HKCCE2091]
MRALAVLLAAIPSAALAADPDPAFVGTWCADSVTLHVEPSGIGVNEHTICDATLPIAPDESGRYASPLDCRNIHVLAVHGDGTTDTEEIPVDHPSAVTLVDTGPDAMTAAFPEGPEIELTRCD